MKYEITKGSEKDFEQAPEWAMQVDKCIETGHLFYTENIMGSQSGTDKCKWSNESEVRPLNFSANYEDEGFETIAQRRPITELVWDGEGLPPVGVECEIKYGRASNAEWIAFRCVGVDCGVAFGWAGNEAVAICKESYEFRPIRSPDEVARDEAIAAMCDIGYTLPAAIRFTKEEMTALYDAGYRKME